MNRYCLLISMFVLAAAAVAQDGASLGDAARENRKTHRPSNAKVWTNENLPTSSTINIASDRDSTKEATPDDQAKDKDKADSAKTQQDDWRKRISDQQAEVERLQREHDVAEREYKVKVAGAYFDAGNMLRDSKKWADDQRKYEGEIANKQKAVDTAKSKLADLQEQARKAGMPPGVQSGQ